MPISIVDVKRRIVDNILKVIIIAGGFLIVIVFIRDIAVGTSSINTILNVIVYALVSSTLVARNRIGYEKKTWIITASFLFIGIKSFFVDGGSEFGFHFFILASIIALLILKRAHAAIMVAVGIVTFIATSALIEFDVLEAGVPDYSPYVERITWAGRVVMYLLLLFILLGGIEKLQTAFLDSIGELNVSNEKLIEYNKNLENQLAYSREMERVVKEKELNFKKLFDDSNDGIVVCDDQLKIIEANNAIANLLLSAKSDLIDTALTDYAAAQDKHVLNQPSTLTTSPEIREVNLVDKNGNRISVEVNYSRIMFQEHNCVLVTIRDIRERKASEEKTLNAVIQAEENERSRVAKDLHDDLGPILSSVKMYIQSMQRHDRDVDNKDITARLIATVDDSIKAVRKISYNLSSHHLQNEGLIDGLKKHIDRTRMGAAMDIRLNHNFKNNYRLPVSHEIVAYRVLLELINNSIVHSQGSRIDIELSIVGDRFTIRYSDNGMGFNIDKALQDNTKGIGLQNILSRVKSINGVTNFLFQDRGFAVTIEINLAS
jgi:PAS domain S-box-containing protein